jgi:hypothetical protein
MVLVFLCVGSGGVGAGELVDVVGSFDVHRGGAQLGLVQKEGGLSGSGKLG